MAGRWQRALEIILILWLGALVVEAVLFGWPLLDAQGRPVPRDFLAVWTAGQVALAGHPAAVYDSVALHAVQVAATGHAFAGYLAFIYPPLIFISIATLLALLPYPLAFATWAIATFTGYVAVMHRLIRDPGVRIAIAAAPAALLCFAIAHNGLFTAALFGGFLLTLTQRPIVAGLFLAALAYKPQYGVLIPLALIAGGHWRTLVTAAAAVGVWLVGWLIVDPAVFPAFLHILEGTNRVILVEGSAGWNKLQSAYAVLRLMGAGPDAAMVVQGALAAAGAALVVAVWRSRRSYDLKAAVLAAAALTATPYVYIYDLPLLTVVVGFLWRARAFDRYEVVLVSLAYVLIAAYPILVVPTGLFAQIFVWLAITRRLYSSVER